MRRLGVVDYGAGNLLSVCRAFEHLGATVELIDTAEGIRAAERLVVPGVGAFGDCMEGLHTRGLIEAITDFGRSGKPFLGICVGMQMMMGQSHEFGSHPGLGLIDGAVEPIPKTDAEGRPHKIPHIGWSDLSAPRPDAWQDSIFDQTTPGTSVYFVHSFAANPLNPDDILAETRYNGRRIVAAVRRGNATGVQFHPEKSGPAGLSMLNRFLELSAS